MHPNHVAIQVKSGFLAKLRSGFGHPLSRGDQPGPPSQLALRPSASVSEAEFERRLPVWIALSDFFLDTYSPAFYINTAHIWRKSGFTRDELRVMLVNDMAPRFYSNLAAVAGVWDGFDTAQVELQMRQQTRHHTKIDWMHRSHILGYLDKVWARLQPYMDAAEQGIDLAILEAPGSMDEP